MHCSSCSVKYECWFSTSNCSLLFLLCGVRTLIHYQMRLRAILYVYMQCLVFTIFDCSMQIMFGIFFYAGMVIFLFFFIVACRMACSVGFKANGRTSIARFCCQLKRKFTGFSPIRGGYIFM